MFKYEFLSKHFLKNTRGAIAILFAFWLVPALLFTSVVVELGYYFYAQTRIAAATDAAALAAARFDPSTAQANALKIFYANLPKNFLGMNLIPQVSVSNNQTEITVKIKDSLPTLLNSLTGIGSINMNVQTIVARELLGLEVAMVLDQTGSMAGTKIGQLRTAATSFVNTLFGSSAVLDNIFVSIVPYVMSVNIGNGTKSRNMVETDGTKITNNSNLITQFPTNTPWKGCVKARLPNDTLPSNSARNELTDDTAATGGKWVAYRAHSTYRPSTVQSTYKITDAVADGLAAHSGTYSNDYRVRVSDNTNVDTTNPGSLGPNQYCGEPIVALTNVKSALLNSISSLQASYPGSGTASNLGMVWGWRTISPKWAGLWDNAVQAPVAYGSTKRFKALILMTDGENQWVSTGGTPTGDVSAYRTEAVSNRYTANTTPNPRPVSTVSDRNSSVTYLNSQLTQLCASVKAQGIEVFAMIFGSTPQTTQDIYRACASSKPGTNDHFFVATTGTQLDAYFKQIANSLKRTRIIH